jgi:hypothetical protein
VTKLQLRKKLDPFWKTRPEPRRFPWSKRVKPLLAGEKRRCRFHDGKFKTFSGTIHADTDPDNNQLTYSREGYKCRRCFVIEGVTIVPTPGTDGSGTIWDALYKSGIPTRGTPHPYINSTTWNTYFGVALPAGLEFAADVITLTPIDSQAFKAVIEYAMLSGATQEPTLANNSKPGKLIPASSIQQINTNIDWQGTKLFASYAPISPQYDVYDSNGNGPLTSPQSMCTAAKQIPLPVYRFVRRETGPRSPYGLQCYINSAAWTLVGHSYAAHELLCTRVESETEDEAFSYVVTYEFQARDTVPAQGSDPAIPGWDVGMFYTIQNGFAVAHGGGISAQQLFAQGQIPGDAGAWVFQIYGATNFAGLNLTPQ